MTEPGRPTFLLHCCCAPCSTHPLILLESQFSISLFFYNPNIHPEKEYLKRKNEIERFARKRQFPIIIPDYDDQEWFGRISGYESEEEGGARCAVCYRIRLEKTAIHAKNQEIEWFGTTLSISPHKKAQVINRIGEELELQYGIRYYAADFKKKEGFKISCHISKAEGFYRQDYCGCLYSRRD